VKESTAVRLPSPGLREQVLARIGLDLVGGVLAARQVLRSEGLESRYGVSRTVICEVVKVLESLQWSPHGDRRAAGCCQRDTKALRTAHLRGDRDVCPQAGRRSGDLSRPRRDLSSGAPEASGNEMFAALARVAAEVLTGLGSGLRWAS
jgi:hypothetical protein